MSDLRLSLDLDDESSKNWIRPLEMLFPYFNVDKQSKKQPKYDGETLLHCIRLSSEVKVEVLRDVGSNRSKYILTVNERVSTVIVQQNEKTLIQRTIDTDFELWKRLVSSNVCEPLPTFCRWLQETRDLIVCHHQNTWYGNGISLSMV